MGSVASTVANVVSNAVESVGDAVKDVSEVVSNAAQKVNDTVEKAAEDIGKAGVDVDKFVNREIPGGWVTVGVVAATVATAGMLSAGTFAAEGAGVAGTAEGAAAAEAATSFAGGDFALAATESPSWWAGTPDWSSVVNSAQKVATAAGTGAAKGAGMGAATSLIAGKDPLQGAIKGAEFGALTGGVGELGKVAELGSTGTRLLQTAAPSLITGADPTKNLMNTAMSLGAGAVGNEFGLNNQVSQTALGAGKALTAGGDPTKALLKTAIGSAVGAGTKEASEIFKDAIDNGMTPEQAQVIASEPTGGDDTDTAPADTAPADTAGADKSLSDSPNQSVDKDGNFVYSYSDGSVLTVSRDGEVVDATESTNYQDAGVDEAATGEYVDPNTDSQTKTPEGGLPTDPNATKDASPLDTAAKQAPGMIQSQLNKGVTTALNKALLPPAAKPAAKPPVSKAQMARTTGLPKINTLPVTQAAATNILAGNAPTQATPKVMTPAERMAAIQRAFSGAGISSPSITSGTSGAAGLQYSSPYVFAAGGTTNINSAGVAVNEYGEPVNSSGYTQSYQQDYSKEFIDPLAGKYLKPGIVRGHGNYTMPGYPFGQLFRIGMAEGGEVGEHNPQFYSEGGLNSLDNTYVKGEGNGTSDSIPAMLANGEFVIPADVVSGLGNGSNDSGAKVLDEFLRTIRQHKQKTGADKLPPDSKGPLGYLLEANKKVKK